MYILSVSPIVKSTKIEGFSYFSKEKVEAGKIVSIPLRNKTVKGLVIECKDFKENRSELRNSEFALKKIKGASSNFIFSTEFLEACQKTAEYFATSKGAILSAITSRTILEEAGKIIQKEKKSAEETKIETPKNEAGKFIIQSSDNERFQDYKSIIRGRFAKKGSVFFCVPTTEDVEIAKEYLTKGIEANTICLSSRLSKKEIVDNWNAALKSDKPVLIIATGAFLSIPRQDIRTIIVERENSHAYRTLTRPYLDIRKFAEFLAKEIGSEIIFGDLMLRSETLKRFEENELFEFSPVKFRFVTTANQKLIDMRFEKTVTQNEFSFVSEFVEDLLEKSQRENKRVFLLTSRKGLAPMIVCGDCGQIVTCDHCSAPMVLYGKNAREKENFLKCRKCGVVRTAGVKCKKCEGWRLNTLGAGIETVAEEIKKKLPEKEVLILDKDHASTPTQIKKIVAKFYEEPASILIGTEMALLYLHEQVDNTVIISIDAMFSLPDFRIRERILNILMKTKDLARESFIIQTRHAEDLLFRHALDGNLAEFYRFEFAERKKYDFPPFTTIIKISSVRSTEQALNNDFKALEEVFKDYDFNYYPAFTERVKGRYLMNGIIRVEKNKWPNDDLRQKLINLDPQYDIVIDAESIL